MRIGFDLVDDADVADALERFGTRYLERIYTAEERAECGTRIRALAGCFAAKEAAMKVLRTGDEPLPWNAIALRRQGRRYVLELTGHAEAARAAGRLTALHVDVVAARTGAGAVVVGLTEH